MINKTNYEAYFLDYHEGSLDDRTKKSVLAFVEANPELREEFGSFELITIPNKNAPKFSGKESLKRHAITEKNYKTWLVAYEEKDLDEAGRREVEQYIELNPAVQPELEILKRTKIHPDHSIRFKNKSSLKKGGVLIPMWARYAAAASIVFALLAYFMIPRNTSTEIAGNDSSSDSVVRPLVEPKMENQKTVASTAIPPAVTIPALEKKQQPSYRQPAPKKPEQQLAQHEVQPEQPSPVELTQEPLAENAKPLDQPEPQTTIVINDHKPAAANQNNKFVVLDDNDLAELGLNGTTEEVENNSLLADAVNGAGKIFGFNARFKTEHNSLESKYRQTIAMGPVSVTRTVGR